MAFPLHLTSLLLALALLHRLAHAEEAPHLLPDFHFEGGNTLDEHFRLGRAMGHTYREAIRARMAAHADHIGSLLATAEGRSAYKELLATHRARVPELLHELEGIANGSGLQFETVLGMSLLQELDCLAQQSRQLGAIRIRDHCSDYMLCTVDACVNAHNEDGDKADSQLFVGYVHLAGRHFTVLNYAGDLLGGMSAFAFNDAGLAFTLNWVGPKHCKTLGLGRNFVSSMLLRAASWDEAKAIIGTPHVAGHNYQLSDFKHRQISNFEVAGDDVVERPVAAPFFHANQYQTLDVPDQVISNSSAHRLARVTNLPQPQNGSQVLWILGDQADRLFPIFHDDVSHARGELSDWTLATVLLDLDQGAADLMIGNPRNLRVLRRFNIQGRLEQNPHPKLLTKPVEVVV